MGITLHGRDGEPGPPYHHSLTFPAQLGRCWPRSPHPPLSYTIGTMRPPSPPVLICMRFPPPPHLPPSPSPAVSPPLPPHPPPSPPHLHEDHRDDVEDGQHDVGQPQHQGAHAEPKQGKGRQGDGRRGSRSILEGARDRLQRRGPGTKPLHADWLVGQKGRRV